MQADGIVWKGLWRIRFGVGEVCEFRVFAFSPSAETVAIQTRRASEGSQRVIAIRVGLYFYLYRDRMPT